MEGQTNCVLCEFKSKNTNSLKQHMENKHKVFNMTIVQVLTQQVERVNDLESEIATREQLIKKAEVDLNVTKESLKREKESLEEKEKAFNDLIKFQEQKAVEESKLVEELEITKELLIKAQEDLEIKTNALDAELQKVGVEEVWTQTVSKLNEVSNVKQEEFDTNIEIKQKSIPITCKYFHKTKGCRRGNKCWFNHDHDQKTEKKRIKLKQNPTKKFKGESNVKMESKHEQGDNMKQIIIELLKLLLRENNS